MQSPDARPYFLETVSVWSGAKLKISKKFLAVTPGELSKLIGRGPKAKDPKLNLLRVSRP